MGRPASACLGLLVEPDGGRRGAALFLFVVPHPVCFRENVNALALGRRKWFGFAFGHRVQGTRMSDLQPLICPKCGADLDVPEGIEVLRCRYCGSKLQLRETGTVRALALIQDGIGKIAAHTEKSAVHLQELVGLTQAQIQQQKVTAENQRELEQKKLEMEAMKFIANSQFQMHQSLGQTPFGQQVLANMAQSERRTPVEGWKLALGLTLSLVLIGLAWAVFSQNNSSPTQPPREGDEPKATGSGISMNTGPKAEQETPESPSEVASNWSWPWTLEDVKNSLKKGMKFSYRHADSINGNRTTRQSSLEILKTDESGLTTRVILSDGGTPFFDETGTDTWRERLQSSVPKELDWVVSDGDITVAAGRFSCWILKRDAKGMDGRTYRSTQWICKKYATIPIKMELRDAGVATDMELISISTPLQLEDELIDRLKKRIGEAQTETDVRARRAEYGDERRAAELDQAVEIRLQELDENLFVSVQREILAATDLKSAQVARNKYVATAHAKELDALVEDTPDRLQYEEYLKALPGCKSESEVVKARATYKGSSRKQDADKWATVRLDSIDSAEYESMLASLKKATSAEGARGARKKYSGKARQREADAELESQLDSLDQAAFNTMKKELEDVDSAEGAVSVRKKYTGSARKADADLALEKKLTVISELADQRAYAAAKQKIEQASSVEEARSARRAYVGKEFAAKLDRALIAFEWQRAKDSTIQMDNSISAVAYSPNGKLLAVGCERGKLNICDATNAKVIRNVSLLKSGDASISQLCFSADGKLIAASVANLVILVDVEAGKALRSINLGYTDRVLISFSPDGKQIATFDSGQGAAAVCRIWEASSGKEQRSFAFPRPDKSDTDWHPVALIAFTPNGKSLVAGCNSTVKKWDLESGKELKSFSVSDGNHGAYPKYSMSNDGKFLLCSNGIWDVDKAEKCDADFSKLGIVGGLFSPDGGFVLVDNSGEPFLCSALTGKKVRSFDGKGGPIAFSPDGRTIVTVEGALHYKGEEGDKLHLWTLPR